TPDAGAATTCSDPPATGGTQTDLQPCGNAKQLQAGTLSAVFDVSTGVSDLGPATLVQVGPGASSPGFAYSNRDISPEASMCTTTTKDGCMHAEATRSLGTITLGTLPTGVSTPTGWAGYYVRVTGVTDTVKAEAGMGSSAPTATASGTLSYYNGSGYTSCSL